MDTIKDNKAPWTRLTSETTLAYSYFATYRDLGPNRSYKKVQEKKGKKKSYIRQLEKWSRQNKWLLRASLYDDYMDQKKLDYADQRLKELHDHAMNHSKEVLDNLISIANGIYCEPCQLQAMEMFLSGIGFMKKDPHLNKTFKNIAKRHKKELDEMNKILSNF